jgi:hypothetical protein
MDPERAAQLTSLWAELEPRIARLSSGPAGAEFYQRLLGEYRVASRYAANMIAAGLERYGMQMQAQGLRAMSIDGIAGAAEYVVGVWIESSATARADLLGVCGKSRALINRALAQLASGRPGDLAI